MLTEYNDNLFYIKLISLSIIESLVKFSKFYRNLNDSTDFQFPFKFMFNVLFSDRYLYDNPDILNMNGENLPTHINFFYNVLNFINENYFINETSTPEFRNFIIKSFQHPKLHYNNMIFDFENKLIISKLFFGIINLDPNFDQNWKKSVFESYKDKFKYFKFVNIDKFQY